MILLDTNVVSEPLQVSAEAGVLAWIDAQIVETLHLATTGLAELRYGIAVLPEGRRRDTLSMGLEQRVLPLFTGRLLPFDAAAAQAYAARRARARTDGKSIAPSDGYIAATAAAHGLIAARRDVAPYQAAGLDIRPALRAASWRPRVAIAFLVTEDAVRIGRVRYRGRDLVAFFWSTTTARGRNDPPHHAGWIAPLKLASMKSATGLLW